MEQVQAFKAHDGKLFSSAEEAQEYEMSLIWRDRIHLFASDPLCPYPSGAQRGMMAKVIVAWETYKTAPL